MGMEGRPPVLQCPEGTVICLPGTSSFQSHLSPHCHPTVRSSSSLTPRPFQDPATPPCPGETTPGQSFLLPCDAGHRETWGSQRMGVVGADHPLALAVPTPAVIRGTGRQLQGLSSGSHLCPIMSLRCLTCSLPSPPVPGTETVPGVWERSGHCLARLSS